MSRIRIELHSGQTIRVERCCDFPEFKAADPGSDRIAGWLAQMVSCQNCGAQIAQIAWDATPDEPR